jgi:ABC-type transporter Mla MlaB component
MLRITVEENPSERRRILHGSLTKRTVPEFLSNWRSSVTVKPCVVDLDQVTTIDKSGEEAISSVMDEGAKVVASGVYTHYLLAELRARRPDDFH